MSHTPQEYRTYAQKMRRADREALYAVVALAIIVVAWVILGIGLAGLDVQVASTPLWIIGGTVGTWLVAVVIAVVFAKRVFANFSLEEEAETDAEQFARVGALKREGADAVSDAAKPGEAR